MVLFFILNKFEIINVKNENKISPIKPNIEGVINSFQAIALDIETYLDTKLTQHLMSVALFDENKKISKIYFIGYYSNEQELVAHVIKDLLEYYNCNIYIHNGAKFDLIFLFISKLLFNPKMNNNELLSIFLILLYTSI